MANDLFAPPTQAELQMAKPQNVAQNDLFAPPTKQELNMGANAITENGVKPDAYIDQKNSQDGIPGFMQQHPTVAKYTQLALNQLPGVGGIAGGIGGGALGSAAGGVGALPGSIGGAALGAGAGEAAKNIGEAYLLGKQKSREDIYGNPAMGLLHGAEGEMGGQIIGRAGQALSSIGKSANAPEIEAATNALGAKPTTGMTSDSYTIKNLENSLSQRPSFAGSLVRSEQKPVNDAVQSATENLTKDSTSLSPVETGNELKKGLIQYIGERHGPIQMSYDNIAESTKNIPLNELSQTRIARNIRNIPEAAILPNSSANKIANDFAAALENIKTADQLKQLKSAAGNITSDPSYDYQEKAVAYAVKNKLDMFQTNAIKRNAISIGRTSSEGKDVAEDLLGQIKDTGKQYKDLRQDLGTLAEGSGLTKSKNGVSQMVNDIDSTPPEKMTDALFKANDSDFLGFLKEKMPDQFEAARQQKLSQIYSKSTGTNGEINSNKFMQAIKNYGPEARGLLFGPESNDNIKNMQTVMSSIPTKIGGSDTPRGISFNEMLNPVLQGGDLIKYGLLKAPYSSIGKGLINSAPAAQMSISNQRTNK